MNLRKVVYQKNIDRGTWYTAEIEVNPDGEFSVHFEYDSKPEFSYEPSDDKYLLISYAFREKTNISPIG